MRPARRKKSDRGFSLLELLIALGMFLLVAGAAFVLLTSSQQRYQTESQVLTSFQEARLGLDQMVRDINDAGFPPPSYVNADPAKVTQTPFAWMPNYATTPCQIGTAGGGTCTTGTAGDSTPGDFDIIIETKSNPQDPFVQWIRYQLVGTTLMRGVADKVSGADPDGTTAGALVPFVQNVVNNSPNLQIGQFQLSNSNPALFPGGAPVPIFSFTCDSPAVPQSPPPPTTSCRLAGADNSPRNIRDVVINLIVAAPLPDATTGQPRLVQLQGRGRRINPNL